MPWWLRADHGGADRDTVLDPGSDGCVAVVNATVAGAEGRSSLSTSRTPSSLQHSTGAVEAARGATETRPPLMTAGDTCPSASGPTDAADSRTPRRCPPAKLSSGVAGGLHPPSAVYFFYGGEVAGDSSSSEGTPRRHHCTTWWRTMLPAACAAAQQISTPAQDPSPLEGAPTLRLQEGVVGAVHGPA
ncbi:unnamed protein product [Boreogadus saida]